MNPLYHDKTIEKNHEPNGHYADPSFTNGAAPPEATSADAAGENAKSAEPQERRSLRQRAEAMIIPMQKMLEDRVSEAKQSLAPLAKTARNTMKEYPGVVVASALGIGLFSGAMMRRTAAVGATTTIGLLAAWYLTRRPAAMSVSAVAADKS